MRSEIDQPSTAFSAPTKTMTENGTTAVAATHATPQCWVCGSKRVVAWKDRTLDRPLQPQDLQITDARYGCTLRLCRCADCGFIFADDDEVAGLVALYEQLDDSEYEGTQEPRSAQMRWLLRKARQARPEATSVLDVGAGSGLLVAEARKVGLSAVGVEPSTALVDAARRVNDVELVQGIFPHPALDGRRFDLIFLVDVVEHVSNPIGLLRACREALTEDGMLIVVTPDIHSIAARVLRHRWWHFRLAHVGYFNGHTLRTAAENSGLALERRFRAKWFFPVSYVAERLEQYLPIAWWNHMANKALPFRWLYRRVVPLDLKDSWVVLLARNIH